MSVYLYGFQPKGNITRVHYPFDNIEIFNLTFRTGNVGSLGNERYEDAISTKLENAWEGKALPEFFVIGKREEDGTVYKAQQPLFHAEWMDTNPLPGKAEPIGYLTKMGGRFRVVLETKNERLERTDREAAEQTSGSETMRRTEVDETRAFEILDEALEGLATVGQSWLASTIRLTIENERAAAAR